MGKTSYNCVYLTSFRVLLSRFTAYLLALLHNLEPQKDETVNPPPLDFSDNADSLPI